jgi:hypothetical protein
MPWSSPRLTVQQRRLQTVREAAERMGVPLKEVWYDRTIGTRLTALTERPPDELLIFLPGRTDTRWWQRLAHRSAAICLIRGRAAVGDHRGSAPFPSHVIYLGSQPDRFTEMFGRVGQIIRRRVPR